MLAMHTVTLLLPLARRHIAVATGGMSIYYFLALHA
jgi:hypothetical protein